MRAAIYEQFRGPVEIREVADPAPPRAGVVLRVGGTGICRSDWHGWMGHDPDVSVPHVPGHEMAGTIVAVGAEVSGWQEGARVTLPFVCGCGRCEQCLSGNQQVCDHQVQPGVTCWGAYAEYVAIEHADQNLVALTDDIDFVTAASLGCRFATSYRAVVAQGRVGEGQWVAVHGCGGVGLSAVMIAAALGARVVAADIDAASLDLARAMGAVAVVDASETEALVPAVKDITRGGAHVSIDALGSRETACNSVACLRKRGRHVQVGLLAGEDHRPPLPMELVIAHELEIVGSHGMQAHRYPEMLAMVQDGRLTPARLVARTVDLDFAAAHLGDPDAHRAAGVTVIDRFTA